jgi:hypothetical protein
MDQLIDQLFSEWPYHSLNKWYLSSFGMNYALKILQ